jgi:hypothetical protein
MQSRFRASTMIEAFRDFPTHSPRTLQMALHSRRNGRETLKQRSANTTCTSSSQPKAKGDLAFAKLRPPKSGDGPRRQRPSRRRFGRANPSPPEWETEREHDEGEELANHN